MDNIDKRETAAEGHTGAEADPVGLDNIRCFARATLSHSFIQLALHFPKELHEVDLEYEEALAHALRLAEDAIVDDPDSPDAHTALGRLILCHDEPLAIQDAVEVLRHALTLEAEHDPAEVAYATALWHQGDASAALAAVDAVIKRGSPLPQPLMLRAYLHLEAGDVDAARRDIQRAVRLAPGAGVVQLDAAEIAERAGDKGLAEAHRQSAKELLGDAYVDLVEIRRLASREVEE